MSTAKHVMNSNYTDNSNVEITTATFSEGEVHKLLLAIDPSNSHGPGNISGILFKEGAPYLAKLLTKLFNLSLHLGQISMDWKSANITPIFKKGNKHLPTSYRPIIIFLDFSKAFDTVPHIKLCHKLAHIGIQGKLLDWITDFLCNRRQCVVISGCSSSWTDVILGVPQGPLLFLVCINDIGDNLNLDVRMFADDCTISRTIRDKQDCSLLQEDLIKVYQWTQTWQLTLNTSKCKALG